MLAKPIIQIGFNIFALDKALVRVKSEFSRRFFHGKLNVHEIEAENSCCIGFESLL
jgi:hypothetical protein